MADTVLSASSVDTFRKCGYRWYLQYVEGWEGEQGVRAAVGLAIHSAIQLYYESRMMGLPHAFLLKEGWDILLERHDGVLLDELWKVVEPDEDEGKAIKTSRRTLQVYVEDVGGTESPRLVEAAFEINVNGIPYSGHLDLGCWDLVVHDHKIKVAKPRWTDDYAFAMVGYSLGYEELTGDKPRDIQLDFMVRLKRDRPYHFPISNGGPVDDHDIRLFAGTLTWVADAIVKRQYEPRGLENGHCRYCPVTAHCQPYQETFNADTYTPTPDDYDGPRGGVAAENFWD